MIGAKKFEMEETIPTKNTTIKTKAPANKKENEASLDKIKGNLLDAFKKNPPERMFGSSKDEEISKPREKKAPNHDKLPSSRFYAPLLKKMDALKDKEEKKEEEKPKISKDDMHKISYMVFSNIRRYLDNKESLEEKNKKISIEIQL